ncbi:MAG: cupredoxin domain-containing protein [Chloroflexi bacterium]|nr:cupredoxin domain-containing protein [Chloroflexota bacterium]
MQRPPTWPGLALVAAAAIVVPAVFALALGLVIAVAAPALQPQLAALRLVAPLSAPQLVAPPAPAQPAEPVAEPRPPEPTAAPAAFVLGVAAPGASARQLSVQIVEGSLGDPQTWGYRPPSLSARVGDTVTWTNAGALPHTVTAQGGAFDSSMLAKGAQWSFSPSAPGTFDYFCALHPQMRSTLVVEAAGQEPAQAAPTQVTQDTPGAPTPASAQATAPAPEPTVEPAPAPAAPATRTGPGRLGARIVEGSLSDPSSWGFDPRTITARVGDTITWTNAGSLPHTVTAEGGAFDSDVLRKGQQWSFTPSAAGGFDYFCALHPQMRGMLVVEAAGQASAQAAPAGAVQDADEAPAPEAAQPVVPAPQPEAPPAAPAPQPTALPAPAPPTGGQQLSAQIVPGGFNPATINAAVGDTITWTNTDSRKHTATATDGSFSSGAVNPGAQWSWTATRAGTISYFCEFHPDMRGTLVVASTAAQPTAQPAGPTAGPSPQPTTAPAATPRAAPTLAPTAVPQVQVQVEIALAGSAAYPSASGRARFDSDGTKRELRVELAGVVALKGAQVDVLVGGSKVGSMAVRSDGTARLDLRTDQGATTVPTSVAGKQVEVKTGAGALVASGSF